MHLTKHRFRLRGACTITLKLPDDLTPGETRKIFLFLKAVAYSEASIALPEAGFEDLGDDFPEESNDDDAIAESSVDWDNF